MSFCNNPRADGQPGTITGNPLQGLCEKVCIEVKKVFDAGLMQEQVIQASVSLTNPVPLDPTLPLTFISAASSAVKGAVSAVSVDRLCGNNQRQARVRCNVGIPMCVIYSDANGIEGAASGTLTFAVDAVMCVPEASIIPFEIEAVVSAIASDGTINNTTAVLDCCVTIVLKLVVETELLVPSYGYCKIPELQQYASNACAGFFELPLYPT